MIRTHQGQTPTVPANCYVDPSAQVIGDVVLGERASIWMNAVVRGDVHSIRIGARSNVQDCAVLHGQRGLYAVHVGELVTIGHNATVHGCVVEDACLIGIGARVLNDARVGEGSIIAAGSVIPEHMVIPPRSLVVGVPGRVKRQLGDADRELILTYARNYLDYTRVYLAEAGAGRGEFSLESPAETSFIMSVDSPGAPDHGAGVQHGDAPAKGHDADANIGDQHDKCAEHG